MNEEMLNALRACIELGDHATVGPWKYVPWHIVEGPPEVQSPDGWLITTTSSDSDAAFITATANLIRQHGLRIEAVLREMSQPQVVPTSSQAPPFGEWQPIESAPKHGRILVTGTEIGTCVASAGWRNDAADDVLWEVVNDITVSPTHWMPLPAGPKP